MIGLLTRGAVDRALNHKLNLTAASLMDAGEYTVQPEFDRIHQRLMTDSGWGQIPVVDRENGDIIGIVTRTDLLKTLTKRPSSPSRQNLARKLNSALSPCAATALLKPWHGGRARPALCSLYRGRALCAIYSLIALDWISIWS